MGAAGSTPAKGIMIEARALAGGVRCRTACRGFGMDNVTMSVEKGELVIRCKVKGMTGTRSASGKTMVIASTRGNATISDGDGGTVTVGLNVYRKA